MLIAHFDTMSVRVPINDNETIDEVEDRMIEAVSSVAEHTVMSYNLVIEDEEDEKR